MRSLAFLLAVLASGAAAQPEPLEYVWTLPAPSAERLTFSPDGSTLASGRLVFPSLVYYIDLRRVADGALLQTITQDPSGERLGDLRGIAYAPDGSAFATSHGDRDCTSQGCQPEYRGLFVWSASGEAVRGRTEWAGIPYGVTWAPDGRFLAVLLSERAEVLLLDPSSLETVRTIATPASTFYFSSDGQALTTMRHIVVPSAPDTLRVTTWSVDTGAPLDEASLVGDFPNLGAVSPDRTLLAFVHTGGRTIEVRRASDGALLHTLDARVNPGNGSFVSLNLRFTPNGAYLAAALKHQLNDPPENGARIRFWDLQTGQLVRDYVEDTWDYPEWLAFSTAHEHLFVYYVHQQPDPLLRMATTDLSVAFPVGAEEPAESPPVPTLAVAPNPARGPAVLTFTLARPQAVRVEAFSVLGRRVAVLHDGPLAAGTHRLALDVSALPPGVYAVRARGETFTASERITVLR